MGPTQRKGRPSKVEVPQLIDTSLMTKEEIALQLKNKIFTLAMQPEPSSQLLVLATKVFEVDGAKVDEVEQMSTEEIMERLTKLS